MITLYLVLPCFNEELVIIDTAKKLEQFMNKQIYQGIISEQSRVCFVDDGSTDMTWSLIEENCRENRLFTGVKLVGNRGHQNALLAGMMSVRDKCDAVVTLDADLQHDIEVIPRFVELYEQGYEVVYGVRQSRKGEKLFKRLTGDAFYRIMRIAGAKVIKNHADYRLMGKKALALLDRYEESNLFLRGIIPELGFKSTTVVYEEKPRLAGESKYSLGKMMMFALNGITSFSIRPLRLIGVLGMLFFFLSIVMFIYSLIAYCQGKIVPGWTSLVAPIWMIGGIQLLAIGILGEYIGKVYIETKHRPRYEIDKQIMQ